VSALFITHCSEAGCRGRLPRCSVSGEMDFPSQQLMPGSPMSLTDGGVVLRFWRL